MPELTDNAPYQTMLHAAVERLKGKDVALAAKRSGMDYDAGRGTIDLVSFGEKGRLYLPDYHVDGDFTVWQHIAFLQYLECDNALLPVGDWVSIRTLEKSAADCVQCGHCTDRCPFHVEQTERMLEIAEYFG